MRFVETNLISKLFIMVKPQLNFLFFEIICFLIIYLLIDIVMNKQMSVKIA